MPLLGPISVYGFFLEGHIDGGYNQPSILLFFDLTNGVGNWKNIILLYFFHPFWRVHMQRIILLFLWHGKKVLF